MSKGFPSVDTYQNKKCAFYCDVIAVVLFLYFSTYMGNVPSLILADTEIIKQIMVKDFPKFIDRPVSICDSPEKQRPLTHMRATKSFS